MKKLIIIFLLFFCIETLKGSGSESDGLSEWVREHVDQKKDYSLASKSIKQLSKESCYDLEQFFEVDKIEFADKILHFVQPKQFNDNFVFRLFKTNDCLEVKWREQEEQKVTKVVAGRQYEVVDTPRFTEWQTFGKFFSDGFEQLEPGYRKNRRYLITPQILDKSKNDLAENPPQGVLYTLTTVFQRKPYVDELMCITDTFDNNSSRHAWGNKNIKNFQIFKYDQQINRSDWLMQLCAINIFLNNSEELRVPSTQYLEEVLLADNNIYLPICALISIEYKSKTLDNLNTHVEQSIRVNAEDQLKINNDVSRDEMKTEQEKSKPDNQKMETSAVAGQNVSNQENKLNECETEKCGNSDSLGSSNTQIEQSTKIFDINRKLTEKPQPLFYKKYFYIILPCILILTFLGYYFKRSFLT